MRRAAALVAAAALLLTACGDDDDGGGGEDALGDDPTVEECIDAAIEALQSFDTSEIDTSDGLDDAEDVLADERADQLLEDHPVLGDDHPCADRIGESTDAEYQRLVEAVDPAVLAILGASSTPRLDEVSDSIN